MALSRMQRASSNFHGIRLPRVSADHGTNQSRSQQDEQEYERHVHRNRRSPSVDVVPAYRRVPSALVFEPRHSSRSCLWDRVWYVLVCFWTWGIMNKLVRMQRRWLHPASPRNVFRCMWAVWAFEKQWMCAFEGECPVRFVSV
jgi:hypothetical protein